MYFGGATWWCTSMRCGLVALAVDEPLCAPTDGTLPGAAAPRTRPPDEAALARTRGLASGRRCDDAVRGVQQTQPRNDNRRAEGIVRFLLSFWLSI
jgi:hypothetical protein